MNDGRAICIKCNSIEPNDWDVHKDSLWVCGCESRKITSDELFAALDVICSEVDFLKRNLSKTCDARLSESARESVKAKLLIEDILLRDAPKDQ